MGWVAFWEDKMYIQVPSLELKLHEDEDGESMELHKE